MIGMDENVGSLNSTSWNFPSTEDARNGVDSPLNAALVSSLGKHRRVIAEYVLDHKNEMSGDSADWHNLINDFFNSKDFGSALAIAEAGLERFPNDASLLADAIRSAGHIGNWKKGDELVCRAEQPDYRADEDWTLAVYLADYLCEKAHTQKAEDRNSTYERAIKCVRDAKRRLPPDDRLINKEAEILIEAGKADEARNVLEDAIFRRDTITDGVPDPNRIPVAQCCLTYLDKILNDSCEYDKIIKIADAGIRFHKIKQRPVKVGYFFYRKALAMDGKIHSATVGDQATGFGNADYVRNTMRTYAIAYALNRQGEFRDVCRENFLVLSAMAGVDDFGIDAFCPSESTSDSEQ